MEPIEKEFLLRAAALLLAAFAGVACLVRVSRGRTLGKMNAFELLVVTALGAILTAGLLQPALPLAPLLVASALLVGLQACLTGLVRNVRGADHLWRNEPALVFRRGHFLRGTMRRYRISEDEIARVVRAHGWKRFHDVEAVVLEADGSLSVFGMEGKVPTGVPELRAATVSHRGA